MKEKDLLEKIFRETLFFRNVYETLNTRLEDPIIEIMVKDCGTEWGERILSLKGSIKERKQQKIFKPIIIEETSWPFERKKQVAIFPQEMAKLTVPFTEIYEEENKGRKVVWDRFLGSAILSIKFKNG